MALLCRSRDMRPRSSEFTPLDCGAIKESNFPLPLLLRFDRFSDLLSAVASVVLFQAPFLTRFLGDHHYLELTAHLGAAFDADHGLRNSLDPLGGDFVSAPGTTPLRASH
jgi:hypothetical protein